MTPDVSEEDSLAYVDVRGRVLVNVAEDWMPTYFFRYHGLDRRVRLARGARLMPGNPCRYPECFEMRNSTSDHRKYITSKRFS